MFGIVTIGAAILGLVYDTRLIYLVVLLLGLVALLDPFTKRVVLHGDRIEFGFRWSPKVVQYSSIVRAQEGKVHWGRGFVTGVVLWVASGELQPVLGSAPMSSKVREGWIREINARVECNAAEPDTHA